MTDTSAAVTPRPGLMRRLYDATLRLAEGRHAMRALGGVSFTEASFFPVPPDPILIAIALSAPHKAMRAALWCTVMSVLGGLLGYAIGAGLYEWIGRPIIELYKLQGAFDTFRAGFAEYGAWIIVAKGLTPIPFKLVTIASGLADMNLLVFTLACALTRGARFFVVAWLFKTFGPQARAIMDRHFYKVFWGGLAVLVGGFAAVFLLK